MSKRVLVACLAGLALSAQAQGIAFSSAQFEVTALAGTADGELGFETLAGNASDAPLAVSTDSIGATDIATAGAIGGPGLLTTSADASAAMGLANAVASAHFIGSFVNPGPVTLSIDLMQSDSFSGTGTAQTSLFVSLKSGGNSLFADYVTGSWTFVYDPVLGTTTELDLTLSSEVVIAFPASGSGNASGFGLTTFAVSAVPEASTGLLLGLGLGTLALLPGIRRQRLPLCLTT